MVSKEFQTLAIFLTWNNKTGIYNTMGHASQDLCINPHALSVVFAWEVIRRCLELYSEFRVVCLASVGNQEGRGMTSLLSQGRYVVLSCRP